MTEFVPATFFKARGTNGDGDTIFDDIDLSGDPDWAGYDDGAEDAVGVYEFKSKIVVAQGKKK